MAGPEIVDLARLRAADLPALSARVAAARLVCFPTDTVYGVGGAATETVAAALVAAKGRDPGKPLQLVFPTVAMLEDELRPAPALARALRALLPGPVTLVVPCPPGRAFPRPGRVIRPGGDVETLGVRVPAWPEGARLMAALELPLVSSSANPSGAPPPATLAGVDADLLSRCDLALDGGTVGGLASTVVDLSRYSETGAWRVLRAGAAREDQIAAALAATEETMP